ncbi:esterase/lipase family protein [Pseudoduganella rivuli]|nr:alpha/beta fold hydrolase [Pseudoduganella rivuli]
MARLLLATIVLLQLAVALAIGWGVLHWWPQGGPWGAALLALACVAAVRLAINLNNFAMAARAASVTPDEHRLDWRGALRLFYTEFRASMLTTSWHMLRPDRNLHLATGMPVLLLHGYGCNSGYWVHLSARLRRAGISHMALDLEPIAGSIDQYADSIHGALQRLCKATGSPRAVIVAHSMGGLASRAYLRRHGADKVAKVITLGTPHHGTALATFGPGVNAREMRLGSPWLAALAAGETAQTRALFVSLWSHHDNIIAPQNSSFLPGARNIEFSGIGHVALGADARILRVVEDEIASITAEFNCAQ